MLGRRAAATMRSNEGEIARFDWAADASREHVAGLLPVGDVLGQSGCGALLGLPIPSRHQGGAAEGDEWKRAHSRGGLDRAAHETAVDTHQAGTDEDASTAEVDVLPTEGGDLAAA
jgi:hypothetical protein